MSKFVFNLSPKTKPFPHQLEAIQFMIGKEYVPLFDEQGLGKTKIVIDSLLEDINNEFIDGAIIVCKKYLIPMWEDEILKHTYLKPIILKGTSKDLGFKFMTYSHFYIINYEALFSEKQRLKDFMKIRRLAMILDESQKIKNPDAKITDAVLDLKDYAKKRIIISGTPIANKPMDIWPQFYFLNPNLLQDDYITFKRKYEVKLNDSGSLETVRDQLKHLSDIIEHVSIRRLKSKVLELPEKIYENVYVNLSAEESQVYIKLRDELILEISSLNGDTLIDESSNILKKLLRLTQISSNPKLVVPTFSGTPSKFTHIDKMVEKIIASDEKVIIWSSFNGNINSLRDRYRKYGSLMIYGEVPLDERSRIVSLFQNNFQYRVLVANPAAAKEGLTLTAANNAIYLDRNFNLVDYLQSQDRIHRISQVKACKIIKLLAKDTIDEYIDEILYKKQKIAQFLQGDTKDLSNGKEYFTKTELLYILGAAKKEVNNGG
ncbi:DEAD/DEAH box helicase [Methanolobus chelungpuianus]|uniref:DEAD/DEAH box helicase n=1 Tax=Methanolobus chelungpuianus TaxID=502115 RepID=UPI0021157E25|nr:DEAD/DEAH box helicase [Methanolobus chelungpuianus]